MILGWLMGYVYSWGLDGTFVPTPCFLNPVTGIVFTYPYVSCPVASAISAGITASKFSHTVLEATCVYLLLTAAIWPIAAIVIYFLASL